MQGYSLVELVTVLLLVSLLAGAFIIRWPGATISVSAQADQLLSDIRYTQSLAMTRGQRYRINFAIDRYWISSADGAISFPHPASGVADVLLATNVTLSSSLGFLVFDGNGRPYVDAATPGTPLAVDAVVTLNSGSDTRSVRVSRDTGRTLIP